jgi:hypothetical protein
MISVKGVNHLFISTGASYNSAGRYVFNLKESIKDVIGVKVRSAIVGWWSTANPANTDDDFNYSFFIIKSDILNGTKNPGFINGTPNSFVFVIPNESSNAVSIARTTSSDIFWFANKHTINGCWFELWTNQGNIIESRVNDETPWMYAVEMEFLIKDD